MLFYVCTNSMGLSKRKTRSKRVMMTFIRCLVATTLKKDQQPHTQQTARSRPCERDSEDFSTSEIPVIVKVDNKI